MHRTRHLRAPLAAPRKEPRKTQRPLAHWLPRMHPHVLRPLQRPRKLPPLAATITTRRAMHTLERDKHDLAAAHHARAHRLPQPVPHPRLPDRHLANNLRAPPDDHPAAERRRVPVPACRPRDVAHVPQRGQLFTTPLRRLHSVTGRRSNTASQNSHTTVSSSSCRLKRRACNRSCLQSSSGSGSASIARTAANASARIFPAR